ncbi:transglycosylase domain-containing protein [Sphingomonas bacterium]|uniref:transglycosylase domain-containing protein n=1 Tax=Sphingomonas bacterium TaxID=1895847 RepID=UPI001574F0D6|nr:PBP1A family penicillin-binding protein [Sphingomonas bacterium]
MSLFDPRRPRAADAEPYELTGGLPPPDDWTRRHRHDGEADPLDPDEDSGEAVPPRRKTSRWRWIARGLGVGIVLLVVAIGWLAITAPLSRSLRPPMPPSITLTADDGTPIARRGAVIGAPVSVKALPPHVPQAFLAIEDRRFYHHFAIDPRGIGRALFHNLRSGGVREGGSTITQQLAKNAFLDNDRTAARKLREVTIAFWLEAWLSKDEILSRYLSNVYFGDNVYGLTAAAKHYFGVAPGALSVGQAAMLAGLVKAPSRLAPTGNPDGAAARMRLVVRAMVEAGFLTEARAQAIETPRILPLRQEALPNGTYFADWVLPAARDQASGSGAGEIRSKASVKTTLDRHLQRTAERALAHAGLRQAQAALVAMRPDGRIVAMVGGRDYGDSPFNRATQARRQPGSAFKLFVYLAALRSGLTPDSMVEDEPVDVAGWKPHNADGRYEGAITLRRAFARSSNVAAVRLTQKVGVAAVIKAARDLGVSTPIASETTIALGTQTMSLLELTAAYAAVADGHYPVGARGLEDVAEKGWLQSLTGGQSTMPAAIRDGMLDLLHASLNDGTGRRAALTIPAYGKTGTTQDSRDALFVGFARNLIVGVWVGNDDNTPNPGLSGGGVPARIWRDFMTAALGLAPVQRPVIQEEVDPDAAIDNAADAAGEAVNAVGDAVRNGAATLSGRLQGLGLDLKVGKDGSISLNSSHPPQRPPPPRDERRPREEPDD